MVMASMNVKTMGIEDIGRQIQSLRQEVSSLRRRVRDAVSQGEKTKNLGWMAKMALDETGCELADIAKSLLGELQELEAVLESKDGTFFKDYERNTLLREELRRRCDIAACIIDQVGRGVSAYEIENKLARTFGGEYKWRANMGNCLLPDIHAFFKNPEDPAIKSKMLEALTKVKIDIEPDEDEADPKPRRLQNIQQIEERIQKSKDDLRLIHFYVSEVLNMERAVEAAQAKIRTLCP